MRTMTLRQIPEAMAGRVQLPRTPRMRRHRDEEFFVATEIIDARSDARRAQILLRLPDAVLLERVDAITAACRQAGFKMGLLFIGIRITALSAVRMPDGQLPDHHAATMALWANGMSAIAGGAEQ